MSGLLIAVDGIDGSGKTTFSKQIQQHLWETMKGSERVFLFNHPGATDVGQKLRTIIKDPASKIDKISERLLFAADNSLFLNLIATPMLANNRIVISDRYWGCTDIVYGLNTGVPMNTMLALHEIVNPLKLDMLLVFKCSWATAKQRKQAMAPKSDYGVKHDCRIEARGDEFLTKVADTYAQIRPSGEITRENCDDLNVVIHNIAKRVVIIDAEQSWDAVKAEACRAVDMLIKEENFQ